jgi:hypothetical protein
MQIHELTQPKKTRLDEVDWVGPDSVFAQAKSAWKTGGKSLINQKADQDAQQARYQDYAANAIAKGKEQGLDQKPTLDSALAKLKTNPVAKQWIDSIVAKWRGTSGSGGVATTTAQGIRHTAKPTVQPAKPTVQPATPVASLGGKPLDPKNPNDAKVLAEMAKQGIKEDGAQAFSNMAGQLSPDVANSIKAWINSQLGTIDLETVEDGVPELRPRIEKLINQVVSLNGDIPAQQKVLHDIFALATAANHVIDWDRRTSGGNNLRYQARRGAKDQPVQSGLTSAQLRNLGALADQAGGPDPRDTGNDFWNNLIKQAMGSR